MSLALFLPASVVRELPACAHVLYRSATRSFHVTPATNSLFSRSRAPGRDRNRDRDMDHLINRMQALSISTSSAVQANNTELRIVPEKPEDPRRVRERDIKVFTAEAGKLADRPFTPPQEQLQCIGGTALGQEKLYPISMQCTNTGVDAEGNVNWKIDVSELDKRVKIAASEVAFEGWSKPGDEYVRAGSGVVRYKLDFVHAGATFTPDKYFLAFLAIALVGVVAYAHSKSKTHPSQPQTIKVVAQEEYTPRTAPPTIKVVTREEPAYHPPVPPTINVVIKKEPSHQMPPQPQVIFVHETPSYPWEPTMWPDDQPSRVRRPRRTRESRPEREYQPAPTPETRPVTVFAKSRKSE